MFALDGLPLMPVTPHPLTARYDDLSVTEKLGLRDALLTDLHFRFRPVADAVAQYLGVQDVMVPESYATEDRLFCTLLFHDGRCRREAVVTLPLNTLDLEPAAARVAVYLRLSETLHVFDEDPTC